jgi:outer membrane protein OmpA-like peptidoglycan-associated protein
MAGPTKGRKSTAAPKQQRTPPPATGHVAPEPKPAQEGVLDLQRWSGNRSVAAMLTVSRQAVPVAPPATDPAFDATLFSKGGTRFDTKVLPKGPSPVLGEVTITLRVHVTFQHFTRADMRREPWRSHKFTKAQLADFRWTAAEEAKFKSEFATKVSQGWSGKHQLRTKDPAFAPHSAMVQVVVEMVDDAGKAHNQMTALKVPQGKSTDTPPPRFRSFVQGNKSTLDMRDPAEPEQNRVRDKSLIEQVGGFAHNSAELTPDMETHIEAVAAKIKARGLKLGKHTTPDGVEHELVLFAVGRATAPGATGHNSKLGDARARAVLDRLNTAVGWGPQGQVEAPGERRTTGEEKFRRVDLTIVDMSPAGALSVTQNTAAHEAGHMFGLGDEYVEEDAKPQSKKFLGDKPSHFGDVEAQLGTEAAEETVVDKSASIMSVGGEVRRAHYVPFLTEVEAITRKEWTVG